MGTILRKRIIYAGMTLLLAAVLAFCLSARAYGASVDDISDSRFKQYVMERFDTNGDGSISQDEADNVTSINARNMGIESLDGIQMFTNLQYLNCAGNELTSLDLSGNPQLLKLICESNKITGLDLSHNPELQLLNCFDNRLESLDLSSNTKLESLTCGGAVVFDTIDLSHNTELKSFAYIIGEMEEIDLSSNTKLETLWISTTPLKQLDLSANTNLSQVLCYGTDLVTLDLRGKAQLTADNVNVTSNKMISLHSDMAGAADMSTENQRPLRITVPDGETSYDLRNIDPEIKADAISGAEGGRIENAVVYDIYDGMEVSYTYTENDEDLKARIIFSVEEKAPVDPDEPSDEPSGEPSDEPSDGDTGSEGSDEEQPGTGDADGNQPDTGTGNGDQNVSGSEDEITDGTVNGAANGAGASTDTSVSGGNAEQTAGTDARAQESDSAVGTGDEAAPAIVLVLLLISAAGIIAAAAGSRRRS